MTNKLISFVVPVKRVDSRPPMFAECIASIFDNAYDKDSIEVLVGIDKGDTTTIKYVKESVPERYRSGVVITLFERPISNNFTQNFYEAGFRLANGDFIWCIGEDVDILTKDYDLKIREATNGHHNPYVTVGGRYINGMPDGRNAYCNFPLIHRDFEHQGSLLPKSINSWGVDAYLHHVFEWLNKPPYTDHNYMSTIDLREEIEIRHRSHHFGDFVEDDLYAEQKQRYSLDEGRSIPLEVSNSREYFYTKYLRMVSCP
tara:strand:+ start:1587 stop:2360 length:774 start_codon:yes stop_codon:yes gene_type:complete